LPALCNAKLELATQARATRKYLMRQRLIAALGPVFFAAALWLPCYARAEVEHWQAVLVAGDNAQPVFDNAVHAVATWLVEHGVAEADIHRLSASASARDPKAEPATLSNMIDRIASLQSQPGDGCFVFITSHGGEGLGIYLSRANELLKPAALARALARGCGSVPTVVVVSGCYSGTFARAPMAAPNRIVLTAARADRSSFGCAADRTYTDYDACLLGSLAHAVTWQAVYDETRDCVRRRERQLHEFPSLPQASFGPAVRRLALQF
jgi:Peptidase C13 family